MMALKNQEDQNNLELDFCDFENEINSPLIRMQDNAYAKGLKRGLKRGRKELSEALMAMEAFGSYAKVIVGDRFGGDDPYDDAPTDDFMEGFDRRFLEFEKVHSRLKLKNQFDASGEEKQHDSVENNH